MALSSGQLLAFMAVAEQRHFGRAAASLGIAPSVLSAQIRRLEDVLGGALFTRGRRAAVALTAAGTTFLPRASDAVARLREAERVGRLAVGGAAGAIEIGYVFSAAMTGVLGRLIQFAAASFPEIVLTACPMRTPEQLAALTEGRLDGALVRPRPVYPAGVEARIVHSEPLLVALAEAHPLAALDRIPAHRLATSKFITPQLGEASGFGAAVASLALAGGFPMPPIRDASDFVTALGIAAATQDIVLAPHSLSRLHLPGVCYRPIDGFDCKVDLAIAWRTENDGAMTAIASALEDMSKIL